MAFIKVYALNKNSETRLERLGYRFCTQPVSQYMVWQRIINESDHQKEST
jgi:hypothetical protein